MGADVAVVDRVEDREPQDDAGGHPRTYRNEIDLASTASVLLVGRAGLEPATEGL